MPHTETVELLPNQGWDSRILICRNPDLVQVFIVVTTRFVVLVDTLINPATAEKFVALAHPYLSGRQLLVVNTHADYDHAWGNQLFAGPGARRPAPLIAHRLCAARFDRTEDAQVLAAMQTHEPTIFGPVVLTKPTITFDSTLIIDGGDLTLELFPTPGHTPDHIALYIPQIRTLLAGDAAELPYPATAGVDGLPAMRASLAALADLDAATVLYCHAPPTTGPRLLRDNLAYFDALERACRAALIADPTLDPNQVRDLAAAVGCAYDHVTPHGGAWDAVDLFYRTQGHTDQLRVMMEWLHGSGQV